MAGMASQLVHIKIYINAGYFIIFNKDIVKKFFLAFLKNARQNLFVLDFSHYFTFFKPKKNILIFYDNFSVKTRARKARITAPCCARSPGHTTQKRSAIGARRSSV